MWLPVYFPPRLAPSKRVYSERKEFAPKGSKVFSFRVDSIQKRDKMTELPPLKVYPFPLVIAIALYLKKDQFSERDSWSRSALFIMAFTSYNRKSNKKQFRHTLRLGNGPFRHARWKNPHTQKKKKKKYKKYVGFGATSKKRCCDVTTQWEYVKNTPTYSA